MVSWAPMRLLSNVTRDYTLKSFYYSLGGRVWTGLPSVGGRGDRRESASLTCLKRGLKLLVYIH